MNTQPTKGISYVQQRKAHIAMITDAIAAAVKRGTPPKHALLSLEICAKCGLSQRTANEYIRIACHTLSLDENTFAATTFQDVLA